MSTFNHKGKRVHYALDGERDAPPLLILNGIMMSHQSWEPFLPALTKDFLVLRVDMLDQGLSDKMEEDYDIKTQADMLISLIEELGLKDVRLAGISYGGSVALRMALERSDLLAGMALFNTTARTSAWLKDIGKGWNKAAASQDGEAYYLATIPYIYSPTFYERKHDWMESRKEMLTKKVFGKKEFLEAMTRLTLSAESHDMESRLTEIKTPTLVIAADADSLTPPAEQEHLANRIPNAHLVTFNDCGHASMYERPKLFVSAIRGFLLHPDEAFKI